MHTLTLVAVDIPEYTIDKTTDKLVAAELEYLRNLKEPTSCFVAIHIKDLIGNRSTFSRIVNSAIGEKLEPYSESTEDPAYLEFDDHTDELRNEYENGCVDCLKLPNGSIISTESRYGRHFTIHDDNKVYQRRFGKLKNDKRSKEAKKIKAILNYPYKKLYKTFEDFAEKERYMVYNEHYKGYGYVYNPNAFYDWYDIGGRWPSVFLVEENCAECLEKTDGSDIAPRKQAPKGYKWVSAARKMDIQWKAMYKHNKAMAERDYNLFKTAFEEKKLPEGVYATITDNGIVGFGDPYYIKGESFPQYLSRNRIIRKYKYPFIAHAMLDGDTYSENEYWVGESNKTDRFWHKKLCHFIDSLNDDTVIVGVDCHI